MWKRRWKRFINKLRGRYLTERGASFLNYLTKKLIWDDAAPMDYEEYMFEQEIQNFAEENGYSNKLAVAILANQLLDMPIKKGRYDDTHE